MLIEVKDNDHLSIKLPGLAFTIFINIIIKQKHHIRHTYPRNMQQVRPFLHEFLRTEHFCINSILSNILEFYSTKASFKTDTTTRVLATIYICDNK